MLKESLLLRLVCYECTSEGGEILKVKILGKKVFSSDRTGKWIKKPESEKNYRHLQSFYS